MLPLILCMCTFVFLYSYLIISLVDKKVKLLVDIMSTRGRNACSQKAQSYARPSNLTRGYV